jgi:hypothetical protein
MNIKEGKFGLQSGLQSGLSPFVHIEMDAEQYPTMFSFSAKWLGKRYPSLILYSRFSQKTNGCHLVHVSIICC